MPDNKQKCKTCNNRHAPPTRKKCCYINSHQTDSKEVPNGLRDAAAACETLAMDQAELGRQQIEGRYYPAVADVR